MIDQSIEVSRLLSGKFSKQNLYTSFYLLSKYYAEQGLELSEISKSVFKWAKSHGLFVKYDLNIIAKKAKEDKLKLTNNVEVYINQEDIDNINSWFYNKNTKLIALAVLCYAKVNSNKNREFSISSYDIGAWVDIHHSSIRRRYLNELIEFGYLEKIKVPVNSKNWNNSKEDGCTRYKLNVDYYNSGEYKLIDNDIYKLYKEIFDKIP